MADQQPPPAPFIEKYDIQESSTSMAKNDGNSAVKDDDTRDNDDGDDAANLSALLPFPLKLATLAIVVERASRLYSSSTTSSNKTIVCAVCSLFHFDDRRTHRQVTWLDSLDSNQTDEAHTMMTWPTPASSWKKKKKDCGSVRMCP